MPECPDFEYIRKRVPIAALARELGLKVSGSRAHCWRTEGHRNNDADPSVSFYRKQNTGKCFVCDSRSWSTIDLVMLVRHCELREAIAWITARYSVPALPKGRHIEQRKDWFPRFRASDTDSVLEVLVLSGLWSDLTNAQRSILGALMTFCKHSSESTKISYRGLMRYSGVKSQATIASALRLFQGMGFLHREGAAGEGPTRTVNGYSLHFEDAGFQSLVASIYEEQRADIALERTLRAEARKARATKRTPCTGYYSLHSLKTIKS